MRSIVHSRCLLGATHLARIQATTVTLRGAIVVLLPCLVHRLASTVPMPVVIEASRVSPADWHGNENCLVAMDVVTCMYARYYWGIECW